MTKSITTQGGVLENAFAIPVTLANQLRGRKKALTVVEVADLLHAGKQTVYRAVRRGELPAMRVLGDQLRFDPNALASYLETRTICPNDCS